MMKFSPDFFHIERDNQHLFYFGAHHSQDVNDEQFHILKQCWSKFLREARSGKRIVLVEGQKVLPRQDEREAITEDGERGLITFLATQHNIETLCPEPDMSTERKELLKRFSKEEIEYYYFARAVDRWNRFHADVDFKTFIKPYLERDKRVSDWKDFEFSLDHMQLAHQRLFENEFNYRDAKFFGRIVNPTLGKTVINKVAQASTEVRNKYIVREIEQLWRDGYSIFVVYGKGHVLAQKQLLEHALT